MGIKQIILGLIGAVAIAAVFIGVFTDYYKFTQGIITAVILLAIGGILARIWKISE